MDIDAMYHKADEAIKLAQSNGQAFGIIAQMVLELNDSHTYFLPPGRSVKVDYGWDMKIVGDAVFATAVKQGSDAEAKGLKEGDQILWIGGYTPVRQNLWKIQYLMY